MLETKDFVGIRCVNSIDFVKTVFDCYRRKLPVVLVENEQPTICKQLGIDSIVEPDDSNRVVKNKTYSNLG